MRISCLLPLVVASCFLVSCGKRIPKETAGSGPAYELLLAMPEGGAIRSTQKTKMDMHVSAGRQKANVKMNMELGAECQVLAAPTQSSRGKATCRLSRIAVNVNGIKATSDAPPPAKKPSNPYVRKVFPLVPARDPFTTPQEQARRKLQTELRKITDKASVDLGYGDGLASPTVTQPDPVAVKDYSPAGRQILEILRDPQTVLSLFVGDATRLLPGKPVAVGAVWHVTLPSTLAPELSLPTAVKLDGIALRGRDKIATLHTTAILRLKGPKRITPPNSGGSATVTDMSMESHGTIVLNLTRRREESSTTEMTGTFSMAQGGQSAKCSLTLSVDTQRETDSAD